MTRSPVLLSCALVFALAACGGGAPTPVATGGPAATAASGKGSAPVALGPGCELVPDALVAQVSGKAATQKQEMPSVQGSAGCDYKLESTTGASASIEIRPVGGRSYQKGIGATPFLPAPDIALGDAAYYGGGTLIVFVGDAIYKAQVVAGLGDKNKAAVTTVVTELLKKGVH
jgi:hypothetical protein